MHTNTDSSFEILTRYGGDGPEIRMVDECAALAGMAPRACYDPFDAKKVVEHYGGLDLDLADEGLGEKIATVVSPEEDLVDPQKPIEVKWLTMLDVHALRQGVFDGPRPLNAAVVGVTVASDDCVVTGLRGGQLTPEKIRTSGRGFYELPPAGQVSWSEGGILRDAIEEEFVDELGPFPITSYEVLGVAKVSGPLMPGLKFIVRLHTSATFKEIQKAHEEATACYWDARKEKKNHLEAVGSAREKGYAPDAWEHSHLLPLPNTAEALQAAAGPLAHFFVLPAQAALTLHAESL